MSNTVRTQILVAKVIKQQTLKFDDETLPGFRELAQQCMAARPSERPTMHTVVHRLTALREAGDESVLECP